MTDQTNPNDNGERSVEHQREPVGFALGRGLEPTTFDGLYRVAQVIAASGLAPKGIESPPALMTAMAMGAEIGLSPMQAIQVIAVVNGRPSIYGDAAIGLVHASGKLEEHHEEPFGDRNTDGYGWRCTVKRKGMPSSCVREFTIADAKTAGLWSKAGPWKSFPERMMQMRARSWALRDTFADVLRGLAIGEEQQDVIEPAYTVTTASSGKSEPEPFVADLDLPAFDTPGAAS